MLDIFDELMVTPIVQVYFDKDVVILYVYAEEIEKITSYFVHCICV